jgi:predicted DNA-binding ribbon-helix-helix protein
MPRAGKSPHWTRARAALADCQRGLINRNVVVAGHRTSFRFDIATWEALDDVAQRERISINELCSQIKAAKPDALSLTVAIRSWLLNYFRHQSGCARPAHW